MSTRKKLLTRSTILLGLILLLPCAAALSQAVRQFQTILGGIAADMGDGGIIHAADGSLVIVGRSASYGPDIDVYAAKLDACGALIWARTYDINVDDYGIKLRESVFDDTFVLVGFTTHTNGDNDAFLLKIDQTGNVVWGKTYGRHNVPAGAPTPHDLGSNLRIDDEGTIYAIGWSMSAGEGSHDGWIWSVAADGSLLWSFLYGGEESETLRGIDWTYDGDLVVAGWTQSYTPDANFEIFLMRINPPDGTIDWAVHHGSGLNEIAYSVACDPFTADCFVIGRALIREYASRINATTGATAAEVVIRAADTNQLMTLNEVTLATRRPYAIGYWRQQNGTFDMHVINFQPATMLPMISMIYGGANNDFGWGITAVPAAIPSFDSIAMVGGTESFGTAGDVYVVAATNNGISGCNESPQPFVALIPGYESDEPEVVRTPFPQCEEQVVTDTHEDYEILCTTCDESPRPATRGGGELSRATTDPLRTAEPTDGVIRARVDPK